MLRLIATAAVVVLCIVLVGAAIGLAGRAGNRRRLDKRRDRSGGDGPSEA